MNRDLQDGGALPNHHASPGGDDRRTYTYKRQKPLDTLDVACLIINKMIGGGIFVTSSGVASLTQSKIIALSLWIFGGIYSFCSIYIYLEYGLAWPYNGGEFIYMAKIFPVPPLLFASCFAWFFILFATTTNNAITFATFINPAHAENPNEWQTKFIACVIVLAVSGLHYRLVNIGILSNNMLAAYKVTFLGALTAAGFFATCRDGARDGLDGRNDYVKSGPGSSTPEDNILAILQVLYSYHGWENANYVTSEIEGNPEEKKKILKRGALIAIGVVNSLYILFNLFVFFILDFHTVTHNPTAMPGLYARKVFQSDNKTMTKHAIYVCIALSAAGNLTGVIFTNARVARDIAKARLIPFYEFFSMSSSYGINTWDGIGTPTGGLVLHATVTCIYIASIPLSPIAQSMEAKQLVQTLYTYGHSIVGLVLGIGILFLKRRMDQYETSRADGDNAEYEAKWSYQVLKNAWARYGAVTFFTVVNLFLIALTFKPRDNRTLLSLAVPITVFSACAIGALVALYVIFFVDNLRFQQSRGDSREGDPEHEFVPHKQRKWIIEYPDLRKRRNWGQVYTPLPWKEIRSRLFDNAEARTAEELRNRR